MAESNFLTTGNDRKILAESLRSYRQRKGISQKELAESCGINQATVSEIETAKGNPTYDILSRLAKALEIPVCALTGADVVIGDVAAATAAVDRDRFWSRALVAPLMGMAANTLGFWLARAFSDALLEAERKKLAIPETAHDIAPK